MDNNNNAKVNHILSHNYDNQVLNVERERKEQCLSENITILVNKKKDKDR